MKTILDGLTAVVLAGGYQTRFANGVSKLTAPIGGRLFVDYLMDSIGDVPLKRVIFLREFEGMPDTKSGWRSLECLHRCEWPPSGTAGALRNMPYAPGESFFVLNGDTISLGLNHELMLAVHKTTMSLLTVATNEKGKSCGTYIFSPEALSMIGPEMKSLEHECIPAWNAKGNKITTFVCAARIIDIGTAEGYAGACAVLPQYFEGGGRVG